MKKFTVDWFSQHQNKFKNLFKDFEGKNNLNFLEIGSFEGKSSCWFYENYINNSLDSTLTCVDTWEGSMEHGKEQRDSIWGTFNFNIKDYDKNKLKIARGKSNEVLKKLSQNNFDFIYVDGSHTSRNVLQDAVLSFDLLKLNGIMTFDDYTWRAYSDELLCPKLGVDSFLACYKHQLKVIEMHHQVSIIKIAE